MKKRSSLAIVPEGRFKRISAIKKSAMRSDKETESLQSVMSFVQRFSGWKIEEGVCINRRRRIFGVMDIGRHGTNVVKFAVGIVIGCKDAKVYIVVGNDRDEKQVGRIPKAFQPSIGVVTVATFCNIAAGYGSACQDICSVTEKVRRSLKS